MRLPRRRCGSPCPSRNIHNLLLRRPITPLHLHRQRLVSTNESHRLKVYHYFSHPNSRQCIPQLIELHPYENQNLTAIPVFYHCTMPAVKYRHFLFSCAAIVSLLLILLLLATLIYTLLSPLTLFNRNQFRVESFAGGFWFIQLNDPRIPSSHTWSQALGDYGPAPSVYDSFMGFKTGRSGPIAFHVLPIWIILVAAAIVPARWIALNDLPELRSRNYTAAPPKPASEEKPAQRQAALDLANRLQQRAQNKSET
jgi:hypothetical protein